MSLSKPARDSFPDFADGDVKVVITGSRQYQLHSGVLRNVSPVLRNLLREEYAAKLSNKAIKSGVVIRYKLVLAPNPDYEEASDGDIPYLLTRVDLDSMGRPKGKDTPGVGLELENGRNIEPIFHAYHAILCAFYNQAIYLGDAQADGLAELLGSAFQATIVAEYLQCIRIVSKPVEATLFGTGQALYKAISDNPTAWLTFSARVKSRAIFKEALIHAAGKFNSKEVQHAIITGALSEDVTRVLVKKGKWVMASVSKCTRFLASYYPSLCLREARPGDKDNISRASYGNDIMMWIAVCIFRHWVCDMMASDRTHHAEDNGWAFIEAVCLGGNTYLGREMLQHSFHVRFPMTGKGMACVEHRLTEIKEDIKQWAMPLKKCNSAIDVSKYPLDHFTHINVDEEDFPWEEAGRLAAAAENADADEEEEDEDEDEEMEVESTTETLDHPQGQDFKVDFAQAVAAAAAAARSGGTPQGQDYEADFKQAIAAVASRAGGTPPGPDADDSMVIDDGLGSPDEKNEPATPAGPSSLGAAEPVIRGSVSPNDEPIFNTQGAGAELGEDLDGYETDSTTVNEP